MKKSFKTPTTIDEYIAMYPAKVQLILEKLRKTIKKAAPEAEEVISYAIPTFKLKGNLVHFGAYENHIGFYPAPSGIAAFKKELSGFEGGKGTIRFPLDKPIPFTLVSKIVAYRVNENLEKAKMKNRK
ncbi:MAG: DUF1801 domain-containing protein [Cyclobacteriaceae bacterium]|nr:DUF1801 domain-containing protein [Cyclobacteriaceae bacterium]